MCAQFGAGVGHKRRQRIFQNRQFSDHVAKRAAGNDLLFVGRDFLQIDAGNFLQFALCFFNHYAKVCAQGRRMRDFQILHGVNLVLRQTLGELAAHTPHFFHRQLREQLVFLHFGQCVEIENALRARMLLGHMVGQLGQCFGGSNAHAHRNARPLHHALAHGITQLAQVGCASEVYKTFVNGVHLRARRILTQNLHHAVGQVGIQSVVAAECKHAVLGDQGFAFKPGLAHAHAQGFGFVGARYHAAIVVRQHHHGHVAQVGAE